MKCDSFTMHNDKKIEKTIIDDIHFHSSLSLSQVHEHDFNYYIFLINLIIIYMIIILIIIMSIKFELLSSIFCNEASSMIPMLDINNIIFMIYYDLLNMFGTIDVGFISFMK